MESKKLLLAIFGAVLLIGIVSATNVVPEERGPYSHEEIELRRVLIKSIIAILQSSDPDHVKMDRINKFVSLSTGQGQFNNGGDHFATGLITGENFGKGLLGILDILNDPVGGLLGNVFGGAKPPPNLLSGFNGGYGRNGFNNNNPYGIVYPNGYFGGYGGGYRDPYGNPYPGPLPGTPGSNKEDNKDNGDNKVDNKVVNKDNGDNKVDSKVDNKVVSKDNGDNKVDNKVVSKVNKVVSKDNGDNKVDSKVVNKVDNKVVSKVVSKDNGDNRAQSLTTHVSVQTQYTQLQAATSRVQMRHMDLPRSVAPSLYQCRSNQITSI
eukprot:gene11512-13431_t